LLGNGDGTFRTGGIIPVANAIFTLAADDFNKDGKKDLVIANGSPGLLTILMGNGDGTFQDPRLITLPEAPFIVVTKDLNSDGYPDLVTADSEAGHVMVLLNDGHGNFPTHQPPYDTGGFPTSFAIADYDGKNGPDLAVADFGSNDVTV